MRRIFIIFLLFFLTKITFSQNVFDIDVHTIEIFFNEPNWDDTLDTYYSNGLGERLIADSVVIDGEADQDVGVKYKGNSSYHINNAKNPLNIKLDYINNGQSIDGYNVLKLSNGFKDPTFVREVLAYEIARSYMPSSKATYANVYINGNWNGLYTCVQSVDNDFTAEYFYERKGPFFKAENTQIQISGCAPGPLGILNYYADTNCYQRAYEMQSANDWTQLGNFLDTLNNHFSEIETVMDIDKALWMIAFENLIVCLDGPINSIPHNYYLFKNNNGRFSPILWDMNQAFGTFTNGLPAPVTNQSLQQLDVFYGSTNNQNSLTSQIFSSDQYKRMYIAHMRTIINEYFSNNQYYNRATQLQQLIDASVASDPNLFFPYATFQTNLNSTIGNNIGLTELMDNRVNHLQSLPEFIANPPSVSVIGPSQITPHTTVDLTATINNANYVYLGYRFKFSEKFKKIEMFDDGMHNDGAAGDGVYGVSFSVDARDVQYYIYAENSDAGIFYPERAEKEFYQIPVVGNLVINEIMASNISANIDQSGEYDDWVELYNNNSFSINLNGYYLSDNENDLQKWTFPNVTIQANDYLVIWCDTAGNSQPGLHTTYRLFSEQEEVYLTDPTGNVIDAVHFVNMPADLAYARVPNGSGVFVHQNETQNSHNTSINFTNDIESLKILNVYPNPATNEVYIKNENNRPIEIFNILGESILRIETKHKSYINISDWKNGIYFVKSGINVVKLIIQ